MLGICGNDSSNGASRGFERLRAEPIWFLVHHLNHSAAVLAAASVVLSVLIVLAFLVVLVALDVLLLLLFFFKLLFLLLVSLPLLLFFALAVALAAVAFAGVREREKACDDCALFVINVTAFLLHHKWPRTFLHHT